jgi:nucleoside-diphosphate-sugar epimerase
MQQALVIGGTGPTGPHLVQGLKSRGYGVAIFHRGAHHCDVVPDVEHIHGDPHFPETIEAALGNRRFEIVVATYGRLRYVARHMKGKTDRLIAVGGVAVYRGYKEPSNLFPEGLLTPVSESDELVTKPDEARFPRLMVETEEALFASHPTATLFRYPYVYGPRQLIPREWCVIRRLLDGRRYILLPGGGLSIATHGYAENMAHAVLLAVDKPQISAGQIYNCGDDKYLTVRQVVEVIADEMRAGLEVVDVPNYVSVGARALMMRLDDNHWIMDLAKIKTELGYHDLVSPVEALRRTTRWYLDHPLDRDGEVEQRLADPFDYPAEDELFEIYAEAAKRAQRVKWSVRDESRPHAYAHPQAVTDRDHRGR